MERLKCLIEFVENLEKNAKDEMVSEYPDDKSRQLTYGYFYYRNHIKYIEEELKTIKEELED